MPSQENNKYKKQNRDEGEKWEAHVIIPSPFHNPCLAYTFELVQRTNEISENRILTSYQAKHSRRATKTEDSPKNRKRERNKHNISDKTVTT
jgi:hypothetical protein